MNIRHSKNDIFQDFIDKEDSLKRINTYKALTKSFKESMEELVNLKKKGLNNTVNKLRAKNLIISNMANIAQCRINHRELYLVLFFE